MEVETKKVSAPRQSDFLDILLCLVKQLKKEEVRYCHWKSNYHLNYALAGVEDWDVLIHVEDFHSFMSIITSGQVKYSLQVVAFVKIQNCHLLKHLILLPLINSIHFQLCNVFNLPAMDLLIT